MFCRTLSIRAFSTLRILPRIGRIAWYCGLRPDLAEPPAESPSTMKISHLVGSFDWQSVSLPGSDADSSRPLRRVRSRALRAATRAVAAWMRLADDVRGLVRVAVQPVVEVLVDDLLDEGLRLGVAQLGLRLALELRLAQLDRDDRGQTLADVLAGEVVVLLAQQLLVARVLVDQRRSAPRGSPPRACRPRGCGWCWRRSTRPRCTAVPLHRDLEGRALVLVLGLEVDHRGVHQLALAGVEVLHEVDDAALVVVRDGRRGCSSARSSPVVAFATRARR